MGDIHFLSTQPGRLQFYDRAQQERTVGGLREALVKVVSVMADAHQIGRSAPDPNTDALLAAGLERAVRDLAERGHPDLPAILAGLLQQGVPA